MSKISTILPDGSYGERDMTEEELKNWTEVVSQAPPVPDIVSDETSQETWTPGPAAEFPDPPA